MLGASREKTEFTMALPIDQGRPKPAGLLLPMEQQNVDLCDSSDRSSLAPECDTTLKKEECLSILRVRIEFSERFYKNATEIYIKSKDQELVCLDADPYRNVLTFQTLNDEKLGKLDHNTIFNKIMTLLDLTYNGKEMGINSNNDSWPHVCSNTW